MGQCGLSSLGYVEEEKWIEEATRGRLAGCEADGGGKGRLCGN